MPVGSSQLRGPRRGNVSKSTIYAATAPPPERRPTLRLAWAGDAVGLSGRALPLALLVAAGPNRLHALPHRLLDGSLRALPGDLVPLPHEVALPVRRVEGGERDREVAEVELPLGDAPRPPSPSVNVQSVQAAAAAAAAFTESCHSREAPRNHELLPLLERELAELGRERSPEAAVGEARPQPLRRGEPGRRGDRRARPRPGSGPRWPPGPSRSARSRADPRDERPPRPRRPRRAG
jgi:hypothetical protein